MRLEFDRDKGIPTPRSSLSSQTRNNLDILEQAYGYQFGNTAYKFPVAQSRRYAHYPGEDRGTHVAYSIVVWGEGPEGQELQYVRRETAGASSGQTSLYIDGKKYRVATLVEQGESILSFEREHVNV